MLLYHIHPQIMVLKQMVLFLFMLQSKCSRSCSIATCYHSNPNTESILQYSYLSAKQDGINTRFNSDLYFPSATLILFQKGIFCSGSRIFNHLPPNIKDLFNNKKRFRSALKKYLLENCFPNLEKYFNSNVNDSSF